MYWLVLSTLLSLGSITFEERVTHLKGDSGEILIDKSYLWERDFTCSWTIGKSRSDINFIVLKFQPFDLGFYCNCYYGDFYIEVADGNHEFKMWEYGKWRLFDVLIKNRSAVVRYHTDGFNWGCKYRWNWHWYWKCSRQNIRVSFHVISQKMIDSSAKGLEPALVQSKPGVVTIDWDPLSLPKKSYIVVPFYNFTTSGEPLMYTIERRNDTSIAVEDLKPSTSYTFKVFAFDSTNIKASFIESTTWNLTIKNETMRLIDGKLSNEGRVEVFKGGLWNKICAYDWWNTKTANVVCRSLSLPSPPHVMYYGIHVGTSFPVSFLDDFYRCNGTENSLQECPSINAQSACQNYPFYQAEVVCGHPPVFYQNITDITGAITSPGYPSFMMQADYRWTFMTNLTRGRMVLYVDVLDLRRQWPNRGCYSRAYIQESGKVNRINLSGGLVTVFSLPVQVNFYSSCSTRQVLYQHYGMGMRARYFSYSEPVSTLKNWTLSFPGHHFYVRFTVSWPQVNIAGYDVLGYLISCSSTQDWANETFYQFVESSSTSVVFNGLIGYTNYDVHALALLRKGRNGTCTPYKSLNASITTPEFYPLRFSPQGVYSRNITLTTSVIGWNPIPRKYTHGVLLGYIVYVFNYHTRTYGKEIKTKVTSVNLTDLSPGVEYRVDISGYTAAGTGSEARKHFSTKCGNTIENQLHGKIRLSYVYSTINCIWKLTTPTPNTLILLVLETLKIPLTFGCKHFYLTIKDKFGNSLGKFCGSRHSMSFVIVGNTEIKGQFAGGNDIMSSSFVMLQNGLDRVPSLKSWNISTTTISSTSVNISWAKYPGNESVTKYVVVCTSNDNGRNVSAASSDGQNLDAIVQNMLKFTEYRVVVLAILGKTSYNLTNVNKTMSKSQEVVIKTAEDVPSKPPQDVTARHSMGPDSIVVSWKPLDNEFANGVIIGYSIYYQVAWTNPGSWKKNSTKSNKSYLKNLKDATLYRIEVSASTKIGEGPRSRAVFIKTGYQRFLNDESGIFATPNYPSKYPSNINCSWEISSPASSGEMVVIFEHFDLEAEDEKGSCSNDFVKVFHTSRKKMLSSAVCGQNSPFAVVSNHKSSTTVFLQSDGGFEKSGFQASYFLLSHRNKVINIVNPLINATTALLSWSAPSSSSFLRYYVLYKRDEVDENWKVLKTAESNVNIDSLLPSRRYIVKVIGNMSETAYWSKEKHFETLPLPITQAPGEITTTKPTVKLMYEYGSREGDRTIPNTWEYLNRCFKINFNDDGFPFMTRRYYKLYVCQNGILRFDSSSYLHWPTTFGGKKSCGIDVLAPYWSRVKKQNAQVFYHVYSSIKNTVKTRKVLDQATSDVRLMRQNYRQASFKASWVLVVTWDKLRHSTINQHTRNLRNTFQAVLITDGVFSYAMFNYPSNGIQWSAPTSRAILAKTWNLYNDKSLPVVGWSSKECIQQKSYFNAIGSGTVNIEGIDDIKGEVVYLNNSNRKIESKPIGIHGKWFYELYKPSLVHNGEINCKNWFKMQPDPRPFIEHLEPCPCTSRQAFFDERFERSRELKPWRKWRSNPRSCTLSKFRSFGGWEQKCCYSHESGQWGALLVGHPNGGHSHRYKKIGKQSGNHVNSDIAGHSLCCINSNLCHLFYQRRPSDDCSRYEPPEWSWMWGDPHFVTLDGKNYTFNGIGEYVMLDAKNGFFQLQSRTRLAKGEGTATIFCAAVIKEYDCSTVQVNLAENGSMSVLIDGKPLDLKDIQNGSTTLNESLVVAHPQENSFKATYRSGISVTVTESKGALSILVALPNSFRNQTKGLLGTWNGNKSDDFTTPEGNVLPPSATGREIHFGFGQKWQVNETSSLFTYNAKESFSTFSNTSFIPMFVDDLEFANKTLEKQALAECNGDINCLFDAASTNDISVGLDTKVVGSQLVNDSAILRNSPPKFPNYTSAILLTINTTKHLQIPVEDNDGDSVTFIVTEVPKGGIVKTSNSTVSISWNVSMEKVNLEVTATDYKGAASVLRPHFFLCACQNGAKCVQHLDGFQSQSDNRFTILSCECRSGYAGRYCENDIDACQVNLNPCYPGVECKDLPAPANESGYECGPCPSGFSGKGDSCKDIDECGYGFNHGCSQICYNTPGSFICGCNDGYTLQNDGSTCQDVNECQPLADCMQKCENTPGSYQCSCHKDFKVDPSDPKKCTPKFPCNDGSHGCQDICYKSNDVASCACRMGYQLQSDKTSCADIDECIAGQDRCNQLCYNNEGGYNCGCIEGFRLSSDNVTCIDINECLEWTFNCSNSLRCKNTIGSYNCRCQEGLYWINSRCRELTTGEKIPTPHPPPKPPTPSKEDLRNSVNVTIKVLEVSEWNQHLDLAFKKGVAREVTTFCAKNKLCLQQKGLERRSNTYIIFTSKQVNLVDLPSNAPSGSMDAIVTFYVKFPQGVASGMSYSIDGAILVDIINGSLGNICKDIGKTLLSVSRYQVKTAVTTETPGPTSPGQVTKKRDSLAYIIGGSVGGAIMVIILLVVIIGCCKRGRARVAAVEDKSTSVEMSQYQPKLSFEYRNTEVDLN